MINFNKKIQEQFAKMCTTGKLFRVSLTGRDLWYTYLGAFKDGNNLVFRDPESSEHNCNHCNNFIRRYGNIVAIDDNHQIITMFDFDVEGEYEGVAPAMADAIKSTPIVDVFFETYAELNFLPYGKCSKTDSLFRLGTDKNVKRYTKEEAEKFGVVKADEIRTFNHFHLDLPKAYVDMSNSSIESIMAKHRDNKQVFQRAMEEIPLDTLELVRDLGAQGSLLDIDTHIKKVHAIIKFKKEYDSLHADQRENWCWVTSRDLPIAKFKNELIGVLCSELAEGEELNKAVQSWNKRVDPANYMKAVAPFTQKQKDNAAKFVEENGYAESFNRRLATIDDIKASEIKHINAGDGEIQKVSMFDNLKVTKPSRHKRNEFDGVEEVSIDKFMKDILPSCTSVEAYLENHHAGNMVTMTTANVDGSKPMFKWNNNYSWTYNGNLAGKSQLAQMVEAKGGRIDGVFRFTHSWNEIEPNQSLMDLHVFMPDCQLPANVSGGPNVRGRRVGWNCRKDPQSGGSQDVDYTDAAPKNYVPVENITFPDINLMPDGEYVCMIHNWSFRGTGGRGKAEIAFGGELYQYEYPATKNQQWVKIATVTLKNGKFSIEHHLPETNSSKEIYGLETKQFHKVNLVCLSPNHWGDNEVGNKHYFFMLDKCQAESDIRSYHIENFNAELAEHRKVLEPLATTIMLSPEGKQLSGLGFNATVRDELIVKLGGNFKRTLKIKF